ncbi:MAG: PUR family DNA/RNA-binding protein [Bacteroidales bacterium]|jgi:hypothetical protein|nr:PUR family DNA/RNA-binding protein [Bacteroidales bacterium]
MDGYDKKEELENNENGREEIFSKVVRAGKRTYFLDVKATRRNDYYLTITESKKRFNRDGKHYFEKHKIFLYKEDFEKFADNLNETIDFIKANAPEPDPRENVEVTAEVGVTATAETVETIETQGYSSGVEFDDLIDSKE